MKNKLNKFLLLFCLNISMVHGVETENLNSPVGQLFLGKKHAHVLKNFDLMIMMYLTNIARFIGS